MWVAPPLEWLSPKPDRPAIPPSRSISRQSPKSANGGALIRGQRLTALWPAEDLHPSSWICWLDEPHASIMAGAEFDGLLLGSREDVHSGDRIWADSLHRCLWSAQRGNNASGRPVSQTIIFFRSFSPKRARPTCRALSHSWTYFVRDLRPGAALQRSIISPRKCWVADHLSEGGVGFEG